MIIFNTKIETSLENITKADFVDAIVNASNSQLYGQHGVNGAIHNAAGKELRLACEKLGECKEGEAKITDGYALPCKYIIHTVGPIWQDGLHGEDAVLKSCYNNVLRLATACNIRNIGFSSISTGKHGFPVNKAALIAINTVTRFVLGHPDSFDKIVWFLNSKETKQVYDAAITLMDSATKIRSTVQLPELPVKRIGLKNDIVLVHKVNSIHNSHNVIPVKGIISVVDSKGSQHTHLIPAVFSPLEKTFYASVSVMMKVKEAGVPLCRIISETEQSNSIEGNKSSQNIQELLKQYGYNAKNLDNLTSVQRKTILAMLIKHEIISVDKLTKYLEDLIQNGKNKPFYHQDVKNLGKWNEDSDFVYLFDMEQ